MPSKRSASQSSVPHWPSLAACGGNASDGGDGKGTITLGFIPSWTTAGPSATCSRSGRGDGLHGRGAGGASEPGPLYTALSQGDIDIYPSAWPEVTHASYLETYGDTIESLGAYYDNAKLTWAVPVLKITSIEDIPQHADALGKRIIGIEPGAGLTKASAESVIPQYGLDDFELVTSSTSAMLAELKTKTDAKQEIVVTLWRPFWANAAFGMRDLEDPKEALGKREALHFLATKGFKDKYPEVAEWIGKVKLDDEQYGSLEDTVVNKFEEGKEEDAVREWMNTNPDVLPKS